MARSRAVWRAMTFAALWGMWSCGDSLTDEGPRYLAEDMGQAFFERAPEPGFSAHTWLESGRGQLTATETLGPEGGMIEFRELGASIVFPKGALSETLTIEARAIAGPVVAFEFSPHGVEFDVPVQIRIDKDRLAPGWSAETEPVDVSSPHRAMRRQLFKMIGVYYTGTYKVDGGVAPLETLPMYLEGGDVVLEVQHFCGYAVASG